MRKLIWKIALIAGLVALCSWAIYPPEQKIRLGKDLRGGVSLIYHVRIDPKDQNPQQTLSQVISVIKQRIDPQGILDFSVQPVGLDRFEIVMPLPSQKVRDLRAAVERAMDALVREGQISATALDQALEAHNAVQQFGGTAGARQAQIAELQAAFDARKDADAALKQAEASGARPEALRPLQQAAADAQAEYELHHDAVLRLSLERTSVERALRLSDERRPNRDAEGKAVLDPVSGQPQVLPSLREAELNSLKEAFPHLAKRLDELTTAYAAYATQRKGFDDPEDLIRLMRGAGVLDFYIAVRASDPQGVSPQDMRAQLKERGPRETDSPVAAWFPINDLKQWYEKPDQLARLQADPVGYFAGRDLVAGERDGAYYLLLYTTDAKSITHQPGAADWSVVRTYPTMDNYGREAVGFELNAPGGRFMNRLTAPHVGEPMAIVLDGQVYSAPTIQQAIGDHGQITGTFSHAELEYLTRVLAAGSLGAKLSPEPVAINTLGPSIGAANLTQGMQAFVASVVAVVLFMLCYYFLCGLVADVALLVNGLMIFGVMSLIDGTFTLPGLAGGVLTMGMAVDANVLIYERMREELESGELDLRGAVRQGYKKAFPTIFDTHVTTLITCFVLYQTATTEVKGFALTLGVGLVASLFTALFVTRLLFDLYTDVLGFKKIRMLPMVSKTVRRFLTPRVSWMSMRPVFIGLSGTALLVSLLLVYIRGVDMFDTEFRGGVSATMRTSIIDDNGDGVPDALDEHGEPLRHWLPQAGPDGVETRLRTAAASLEPDGDAQRRKKLLDALHVADIIKESPEQLPAPEQWAADAKLTAVRAILRELTRASVLTVGKTETRDGAVWGNAFQMKVASPKGIGEEETVTGVVVATVVSEFGDQLDVSRALRFRGEASDNHAAFTFPVTRDSLGDNFERPRFTDRVSDFRGGVAIVLDDIEPPARTQDIAGRIERMRLQPDFADCAGREMGVFGLELADPDRPQMGYRSLAVLVRDPERSFYSSDFDQWDRGLAAREWALVRQALQRQTSLEQVSSFSSAVAQTLQANAVVAIWLSLLTILVYIWVRFGSLRYSAGAILCLIHDVIISLGFVAASAWLARTALGRALLIEEFRIDMGVVAAVLTIIGYSLNDTIVTLDRIRENRGKLPIPTAAIVDGAINQTFSRTVLTSWTTFLSVLVMYIFGGTGIRAFSYCMLIGIIVGTYSTVAIAATLVTKGGPGKTAARGPAALQTEARAKETAAASA